MKKLVLIKVGGSLITDKTKSFVSRSRVIKRLGQEIKSGLGKTDFQAVVAHGSGSFGHMAAAKYKDGEEIKKEGLPEIADAAATINRIVTKEFLKAGLECVSFSPLSFSLANKGKRKRVFERPIREALELGFTPLVYGDIVIDEEKGVTIFSGETTLTNIGHALSDDYKIAKIIHCGDTDGVYDADRKTIPLISRKTFKSLKKEVGHSNTVDVTGGMLHKVEESLKAADKFGCEVVIINGKTPGNLKKAIAGEKIAGTRIV